MTTRKPPFAVSINHFVRRDSVRSFRDVVFPGLRDQRAGHDCRDVDWIPGRQPTIGTMGNHWRAFRRACRCGTWNRHRDEVRRNIPLALEMGIA